MHQSTTSSSSCTITNPTTLSIKEGRRRRNSHHRHHHDCCWNHHLRRVHEVVFFVVGILLVVVAEKSSGFTVTATTTKLEGITLLGQPKKGRQRTNTNHHRHRSTLAVHVVASTAPDENDAIDFSVADDHNNDDVNNKSSKENTTSGNPGPMDSITGSMNSQKAFPATPATGSSSQKQLQTERFHQDMIRVLESRADRGMAELAEATLDERRHRPDILEHDKDGVQRVLTMLDRMVQMGLATEETFQIAMRACLQRARLRWRRNNDENPTTNHHHQNGMIICAADELEHLLEQLEGIITDNDISLETYRLVLQAYATCSTPRGGRNYAQKAELLLQRMQHRGVFFGDGGETQLDSLDTANGDNNFDNDNIPVEILTHILHAWAWQQANLQPGYCAERAQDYLEQIERRLLSTTTNNNTGLLMQCYDWVLEAWSKSGSVGSAESAARIFGKMKELNQTLTPESESSSSTNFVLNTQTYSNAILAWSKVKQDPQAAQRAHDILVELLDCFERGGFASSHSEPELIAFNGVITAWARNGQPDKAEEVLWFMDGIRSKCRHLIPDVVTYNSVLHAHVMSPHTQKALQRIRKLVEFMQDNCQHQPAICPDSFTFNTLMKAWIRSGEPDLAEQSEQILFQMERLWERGVDKVEPTNRHFNVVINAYAKSSNPFAAKKAYDLLQRMKGGSFRSKPDIITYTSVIECFSKSADPAASQIVVDLLEEAFAIHERTGDPAIRPNLRTFASVISTLANCNGSVVEARGLLARLVTLYDDTKDEAFKPNAYPYNHVLNCAANTMENKMEAFRLATQTYQEMRQSPYASPDGYTYAFWFKCCNNLLVDDDNKELKSKCMFYAFEECKKDGLVSDTVLNRLQRGIPTRVLEEWLGISKRQAGPRQLKASELPPEWSRNVR